MKTATSTPAGPLTKAYSPQVIVRKRSVDYKQYVFIFVVQEVWKHGVPLPQGDGVELVPRRHLLSGDMVVYTNHLHGYVSPFFTKDPIMESNDSMCFGHMVEWDLTEESHNWHIQQEIDSYFRWKDEQEHPEVDGRQLSAD